MNVLVTGGAGYIGSVAAAALLEAGHDVIVYDNLCQGHRQAVPKGARFVEGEIDDRGALDRVFRTKSIEAVMHFAALLNVGESMQIPERYFRNNTCSTLTLLEAMHSEGIHRLVFSSTAALYGEQERIPIEETHPLGPASVYGESKLLVERMLEWFQKVHGLRYASLRYFNAAGATGERGEDHAPETHLIPLALQVALGKRASVQIYGTDYPTPDGTCVRDYIHVQDLATAHLLALGALEERSGLIYNLGNGEGASVRQLIEAARRVTGHPIPAEECPRRPGDPAALVASSAKIRRELGWRPQYPELEAILASAWEWHRRHPNGY
ncbi:MAG: UDP-glucose 4-epimerase GalE [Candidatus Eisenbacteria bacterium]|uniref:UDP-glucose 4-epimerase n=1 Tax=Eiseniibacteriota bacterium TaxID=2212470 RepID=A0A538TBD3_UNCEI|nr:MAG: UDP-glucose 4-epimerase GalE [Candidatus Eisenbacteria bacterium]